MRKAYFIYFFLLVFIASSLPAAKIDRSGNHRSHHFDCLDNLEVEIENESIILTCEYDNDLWVEITPESKLYISGQRIYLDRDQKRMVGEYYDHFMAIIDRAKLIGKEGAKIGMEGAKIGLLAAKAALKMLTSDYDSDDLEEEIEDEVEDLEIRAEELEELAEELEEKADEFEDLHYSLKSDIDELNELDWY